MIQAKDSWKDSILHTDILSTPTLEPNAVASSPLPQAESKPPASTLMLDCKQSQSSTGVGELGREGWRSKTAFPSDRKLSLVVGSDSLEP
jgi:hypothetical protein